MVHHTTQRGPGLKNLGGEGGGGFPPSRPPPRATRDRAGLRALLRRPGGRVGFDPKLSEHSCAARDLFFFHGAKSSWGRSLLHESRTGSEVSRGEKKESEKQIIPTPQPRTGEVRKERREKRKERGGRRKRRFRREGREGRTPIFQRQELRPLRKTHTYRRDPDPRVYRRLSKPLSCPRPRRGCQAQTPLLKPQYHCGYAA